MRAYTETDEEAIRTRELLNDWKGESFLTAEQHQRMEQETLCELRRTNIFLRLVLFLFTLIISGAAVGLFFNVFLSNPSEQETGVLLIFAALSYAAAEISVSQFKLYRYGIEEALAVCSVGFLCAGLAFGFLSHTSSPQFLVPAAGAIGSLWIWHRFGLPYAFPASMIFAIFLPGYWTSSPAAQHAMLALLYAAGLAAMIGLRPRARFTYLDSRYSLAEALLWFGIYASINLQLSTPELLGGLVSGVSGAAPFPNPFYWATWVLTWLLPPLVLVRGLRNKDRFVVAAGGIAAILTFATNKPYLGWPRHTWDPMLLGAFLTGIVLLIRRWLAKSPNGIRRGLTAQRLSGKDQRWMNLGSSSIGLVAPNIVTPHPNPEFGFGGGDSGGGGASSDF